MQVLPGDFLEIAMQCGFYTIFWSETFRSLLKLAFCARNNRANEEEEDGYEAIKLALKNSPLPQRIQE